MCNSVLLHRWIMPEAGSNYVDHINGNSLDNRRSNLRIVIPAENSQNRKGPQANSSSGIRGVSWYARKGMWQAELKVNGRRIHLDYFPSKELAGTIVEAERARLMPFSKEALEYAVYLRGY